MKHKKIFIIAGEPSGDLQASYLVASLKQIDTSIEIFGVGGERLRHSGVEIIYDITDLAVVGFIEIFKHITIFKRLFNNLTAILDKRRPDGVILVDYPGFNLRFARIAKKKDIPVIYYISPQIWAWGKSRIKDIKRYVDKMIVIFGFEETLYREMGVNVDFVGHPFVDIVRPAWKKEETIKNLHLKNHTTRIGLMPGSRQEEIKRHLPIMLKACEIMKDRSNNIEFILSKRKEIPSDIYNRIIGHSKIKPHSIENKSYEIMDVSDLIIICSGSATLEAAIMEKPMVIIYKTSLLTWLIARNLIKISDIGLVNIVAGQRIVPELVQFKVTPENIAGETLAILNNSRRLHEIKENLRNIKSRLGSPGASFRAAHAILKFLST